MRTALDWPPIFAHVVAHPLEPLGEVAARFGIKAATLRPALKHEADKPGGGRLAGHPVYGAKTPPARTEAIDPSTAAAVYVPVGELVPWLKNPRRNDESSKAVAASILRFGFGAPLLARLANREVIAGHTRIKAAALLPRMYEAAVKAGTVGTWHPEAVALATDAIPVLPVRYRDLSEGEAHALALADNRVGELATWDEALLGEVFRDLEIAAVDTSGMGWAEEEVEVIARLPAGPGADPNAPPSGLDGDGITYESKYALLVHCRDEPEQIAFYDQLKTLGFICKVLAL